jgi:hypothetical protein
MPGAGVSREQVFETAEVLVREGRSPIVVAVRTRLDGGSPNTITPLLAEWRDHQDTQQAASVAVVPRPVEAIPRQVWGIAWREAQRQLADERAALGQLREETERERADMRAEGDRVVVDEGQVLVLIPGESLGQMERRASQQLRCVGPITPQGWPRIHRREGRSRL